MNAFYEIPTGCCKIIGLLAAIHVAISFRALFTTHDGIDKVYGTIGDVTAEPCSLAVLHARRAVQQRVVSQTRDQSPTCYAALPS